MVACVQDIKPCGLFKIPDDILDHFMDGSWIFRDGWKETDQTIYMNSLGFFCYSAGKSTGSLENSETSRKLFCATSVEKYSNRQAICHLNSVGQVDEMFNSWPYVIG